MELTALLGRALTPLGRTVPAPPTVDLPRGRRVDLPGRGAPYVVDIPGPEGAPTLMLLHALGCTAYLSWFPSLGPLSERYRVVMFDQRWHGRGIRSPEFRLDDCADDAAAVADALGIDRFVPVGYSMGGAIAQLVWRRHRDRVAGLVLAATARNFQGKPREQLWFTLVALGMARCGGHAHGRVERLAATLAELPDLPGAEGTRVSQWAMREFRSTSAWTMAAALGELGRFDSSVWIRRVEVPTSVLVMTNDRVIPTRRQVRLAESIPGAVAHYVRGSHASMVLGADDFVPGLVTACDSVALRMRRAAGAAALSRPA